MSRLFLSLSLCLTCFLIFSCSSALENKTDYQICKGLAEYPPINIHTKARKNEVAKRGLNCRNFAERIDRELAAERLAKKSAPKTYNTYSNTYQSNSSSTNSNSQINDYSDLVCTNGRVMTNYGCRYR